MAPEYDISHSEGITKVRFHVEPTFELITSIIDEISERFPYTRRLWDLSSVRFDLDPEVLQRIARYSQRRLAGPGRAAFVATSDLAFGELRMFQVYRERDDASEVRVFRAEGPALDWLLGEAPDGPGAAHG